jgi:hypothetical protein
VSKNCRKKRSKWLSSQETTPLHAVVALAKEAMECSFVLYYFIVKAAEAIRRLVNAEQDWVFGVGLVLVSHHLETMNEE